MPTPQPFRLPTSTIASSNMVILFYLESLIVSPKEKYWTYELLPEMPHWDDKKKNYVCKGRSKKITLQEAKELIRRHNLMCVCDNKYGKIYK